MLGLKQHLRLESHVASVKVTGQDFVFKVNIDVGKRFSTYE